MIRREDVPAAFVVDGSWRDLYVLDTTAQDWREMFRFVRESGWIGHKLFLDEGDGVQSPWPGRPWALGDGCASFDELLDELLDDRRLQTWGFEIDLGGLTLASVVFEPSVIEFYFDPGQLDVARFKRLVEFMEGLGRRLKKDVLLTAENRSEAVIARYEVREDGVRVGERLSN